MGSYRGIGASLRRGDGYRYGVGFCHVFEVDMTRIRLLLIALLLTALAASHWAVFGWGHANATASESSACQAQTIGQLDSTLQQMQQLTRDASAANLALGQTISARQQADAQATTEIRNALKTTAHLRVDCVFDDGVMRALSTARQRANHAAASGLINPVPSVNSAQQ